MEGRLSDCPWGAWPQAPSEFCEESLCAWVREPANTWSNAGFLIVAAIVYMETRRPDRRHLRALVWIMAATGIGSAFFHASETFPGVLADYGGMFLGLSWMLVSCGRRWYDWSTRTAHVVFWVLTAACMTVSIVRIDLIRWVYLVLGTVCGISELAMIFHPAMRAKTYVRYFAFWAAFVPAVIVWILDLERTWCDPSNHLFNGHALWHVLNAAGFYAAYRYYLQFDSLKG